MALQVADVEPWENPLYVAMGQLVVIYNHAEERIKTLLTNLVADFQMEHNLQARIMASELGAVGLENAIKAIAGDILPRAEREAVVHAVNLYERVRGYRNFYVHGVILPISPTTDRPCISGQIATYSAKGALAEHRMNVSVAQIEEAVDLAQTLSNYVSALTFALRNRADPSPASEPPLLPDMPPLPPRLERPRLNLRERFPPPEV